MTTSTLFSATYTVNQAGDSAALTGGSGSGTSGDLRFCINAINAATYNAAGTHSLVFTLPSGQETITLGGILSPLNLYQANTLTIDGKNSGGSGTAVTIDGNSAYCGLFAHQGNIAIQNLSLNNCLASGGSGSGGGGGLGGALFVNTANVTVTHVSFSNNSCLGGAGTLASSTNLLGGGGLGGNALGNGATTNTAGGGGGGFSGFGGSPNISFGAGGGGLADGTGTTSPGANTGGAGGGGALLGLAIGGPPGGNGAGTSTVYGGGGGGARGAGSPGTGGGPNIGGSGGAPATAGSNGLSGGGGGGGGGAAIPPTTGNGGTGGNGGVGGGGGGGGGAGNGSGTYTAGNGGMGGTFGGGGGGGSNPTSGQPAASGGAGGFGGGGGGGGAGTGSTASSGGSGGFGGGGGAAGGATLGAGGAGGFGGGGGTGSSGGAGGVGAGSLGGGGAGLGGAIFLNTGQLTIKDSVSISGGSATGGAGSGIGNTGGAAGAGIFVVSSIPSKLVFAPSSGTTVTIGSPIADAGINSLPGGTYTAGSGAGATLTMNGAGTLNLSAVNTYQQNTIVNAGTVLISGSVTSPATINAGTLTVSGMLNGNTSVTHLGTLNVAGSGTVTGSTTGTNGNVNVAGQLTGPVTLTTSALAVSGQVTGATTLSGGVGFVSGTLNGTLLLNSGAVFSGNGSVTGSVTVQDATLAPAVGSPVLSVNTVTFHTNSTFQIHVDPTQSSELSVTTTANLAGTVQVVIPDLNAFPESVNLTILTSSGLNGSFNPTPSIAVPPNTLPGLALTLSQTATDVLLGITWNPFLPLDGLSGNEKRVAQYLDNYASRSTILLFNGLDADGLKKAYDAVSPARNAFAPFIIEKTGFAINQAVVSHVEQLRYAGDFIPCEQRRESLERGCIPDTSYFATWLSGFEEFGHNKAEDQNPGFAYNTESLLVGLDLRSDEQDLIGFAGGYADTCFYEHHNLGTGAIRYYYASAYTNLFLGHFYFAPAVSAAMDRVRHTRKIIFNTFSAKAKSSYLGRMVVPHLDIGYEVKTRWGLYGPFASGDFALSWQNGFHETGADPFNAAQHAHFSQALRAEGGLLFCEKWEFNWGAFFLKEKLSYVFEKPYSSSAITSTLSGITTPLTVFALGQNENLGSVGVDLLVSLFGTKRSAPFTLSLSYDGEFGASFQAQSVRFSVNKSF